MLLLLTGPARPRPAGASAMGSSLVNGKGCCWRAMLELALQVPPQACCVRASVHSVTPKPTRRIPAMPLAGLLKRSPSRWSNKALAASDTPAKQGVVGRGAMEMKEQRREL